MKESELLSGRLEETNEAYAIAKITGIKLCHFYNVQYNTDYRSLMPTNLYGQGDNYHPTESHVIPALIGRFHEAKINNDPITTVWGSGEALREFLYVDDLAEACLLIAFNNNKNQKQLFLDNNSFINVGFGKDISIKELALKISNVVDYRGRIVFDPTKPDGTPRKILDSSHINSLGWKPKISLEEGLKKTYQLFKEEI